MTAGEPSQLTWIGRTARALSYLLLGYWGLFALLAPVTVWDAQVYNLGRLPLAELGGLFHNPYWTTERQLSFPLTFDAIHLPLLHIGAGYALPSFFGFFGVLVITKNLLNRWHGVEAGWLGVLVLLGLPTLAYQAVGTKNDVAILFGLMVWLHAMIRWQDERRPWHLVFAALAIGFMAGSKSSGLIPAILCTGLTFWLLRRAAALWRYFLPAWLLSVLLLGSIETYVASAAAYGHPLGPPSFVHNHRNNDGVRGAAANAFRYTMGNLATGAEPWLESDPITPRLEEFTRSLLPRIGLANAGYRQSDFNDSRLVFSRTGWDASSDYGPLGTLCIGLALLSVFWWRPADPWWRLAVSAVLLQGAICYTVAWMPWNNRFLLLPFALLGIALVSVAQRYAQRSLGVVLLLCATYGALVYPCLSYNKSPADLVASVTHREFQEFKERKSLLPVLGAIRDWRLEHQGGDVLLSASSDSWVLPFLTTGFFAVRPIPIDQLAATMDANLKRNVPTLLVTLNRPDFRRGDLPVHELQRFPDEPGTAVYVVRAPDLSAPAHFSWIEGYFTDGWVAPVARLELENWRGKDLTADLWNPTPMAQTAVITSSLGQRTITLDSSEHVSLAVRVAPNDVVTFQTSPGFAPRAAGLANDDRELGLRVTVHE